ncbi:hypothetical protein C8R44DRAFT_744972 [Mycena epipterygia]|nr:hypothetical protein C8R44DRAFT_744972 [Mycena epipterygia]
MENEATSAGLRLDPRLEGGVWDIEDLREDPVHESLTGPWRALEHLPLTRLSFNTAQDVTSTPHRGAGRIIVPGQHIHISVAFKKDYIPRATFLEDTDIAWESFVGKNIETSTFEWAHQLGEMVEMDLFNGSLMIEAVENLQALGDTFESGNESTAGSSAYWIKRLEFMALSGQLAANYLSQLARGSPENSAGRVRTAIKLFQKLQLQKPGTFDADVATLLEYDAHRLVELKQWDTALQTYREAETIRRNRVVTDKVPMQDLESLVNCLEARLGQ